jgi:2-polyprenyl-3-methyl-5-hydroxy-6-metoxy-1,4-benzoquinol methylase
MGTKHGERRGPPGPPRAGRGGDDPIRRVILSYDDPIIRTYSYLRFKIFRQRFLDEIGQYLPREGRVLDVGCGFGLFSLYYAQVLPGAELHGFDLNDRRIAIARRAAIKLGLENVSYSVKNAIEMSGDERWSGVYMLDVVHHVPRSTVRPLLEEVRRSLSPGSRLIIKELDTSPGWKRVYSHALDWAMSPSSPVSYWSAKEITALLDEVGFDVSQHAMVDYLPYPHMLYVCTRR